MSLFCCEASWGCSVKAIYLTFFLSGFPALLYQLVWQRKLFTFFGVNIESISVVVTAFMLGIGFGSLLGGKLSKYQKLSPLLLFAILELIIAVFGWFSLQLLDTIGIATAGSSLLEVFIIAFSLVFLPTICMGATLPLLTTYLIKRDGNVGKSVGALYFVNTLGSAAACFVAAIYLFANYGNSGTVHLAVFLNVLAGGTAFLIWATQLDSRELRTPDISSVNYTEKQVLSYPIALILACLVGFISLSYEIIWARAFMFVSGGWALAFPILLGSFLLGIALGSALARLICKPINRSSQLKNIGWFLIVANLFGYATLPVLSLVITKGEAYAVIMLFFVITSAAMLGAILPLIAHFGISPNSDSGSKLSFIYMSNIVGSAAGSLITGFILMQYLETNLLAPTLAIAGIILSLLIFLRAEKSTKERISFKGLGISLVLIASIIVINPVVFKNYYARLLFKRDFAGASLANNIENRSGVVSLSKGGTVYGGGGYDGVSNIDLRSNTSIVRAYSISAFHSDPKKVLMFGLASGSWAQIIANHPSVEKLVIVEINDGYIEIVKSNPIVASLLENPKVEIIKDDGRRWLNSNPDELFDVMLHNITLHWRFYAANLLSEEFLKVSLSRLKDDGVILYNGTCSPSAYRTAALTFPYSLRFLSLVVGSRQPIVPNADRWKNTLVKYRINNKLILDLDNQDDINTLDYVLLLLEAKAPINSNSSTLIDCFSPEHAIEDNITILANTSNYRNITDDNMGDEWLRQPWKDILIGQKRWSGTTSEK